MNSLEGLTIVGLIITLLLSMALVGLTIYGMIISFRKAWYIGVAALLVGGFALVIGTAKAVFKTDLLK